MDDLKMKGSGGSSTVSTTSDISIVTPTFRRAGEVVELLENISSQLLAPKEVILVDGAPPTETETQAAIEKVVDLYPFPIRYLRHQGGTATQRNAGVNLAEGSLVALIDDDVRLERDFLLEVSKVFAADDLKSVGGVVGYRTNQHFRPEDRARWRWYKRLKLLKTFEPGRYDFATGYPINNNMQPPFEGTRPVDFMTTACAVWRREVFESGIWFDEFFRDYGVLEDAHFSLRAAKKWKLVQCGDALCRELRSPNGRSDHYTLGYKCVINYYYVFRDVAAPLSLSQKLRFWRFQAFEFVRVGLSAIRRRRWHDLQDAVGRIRGVLDVLRGILER